MRDTHSDYIKSSCYAWRKYSVSTPLWNASSFVYFVPSLASSPTDLSSSTSATDTASLLTINSTSCLKLANCIMSLLPHCPSFPFTPSSRSCSSSPSCCLCRLCCSPSSPAPVASIQHRPPLFASPLVRTCTSLLSRIPTSSASHARFLPWCSPTIIDCVYICVPPSFPRIPTVINATILQKVFLRTRFPACTFRLCSTNTLQQVSSPTSSVSSSSLSFALPRVRLSVATATAATVLAVATAIGGVAAGAAAVVSAAAATAAVPAATSAGNAIAATAACAAAVFVADKGGLSLVSSFLNSRLHRFLEKSYPLSWCSTSASKRSAPVSPMFLPFREDSSPSSCARGCYQLCKTSSSSIISTFDNLDSTSSSNVNVAASVPRSHASGRCTIADRLRFLSFPSSLQATFSVLRPCPIPASTSCSPPVDAIPVPLGTDSGATGPPPTGITILIDQPGGVSAMTGAASRAVPAVTRGTAARRLLGPFEVASGEVKERRSKSILQGLRKLLEESTVLFWKGNRWKGPQKNKWKWYHRHGYWATRKKLIDFTKYRRYGYHERYGMGRPKMKFWEDPSRYKRLRQAVRFW